MSARVVLEIDPAALSIVAAPPDLLSQRNVEQVTGIPPSVYLDTVRSPTFPLRVRRLGKLRIVERAAFIAWLLAEEEERAVKPANDATPASDDPEADAVLARHGYKRTPPPAERRRAR